MKQYSHILLDWDGNIAKTLELWPNALSEVLNRRGFSLTRQQLIESTWGFVDYATKHTGITAAEAAKALNEAITVVNHCLPGVELYPDVPETLAKLKANGKHLGLITTSERRLVEPVLERFGLTDVFEVIVTDEDVERKHRKPHPKPLQLALEKMGGIPETTIMVGDRDKDILAAHNAGMASVLFCSVEHRQFYNVEKLMAHKPTFVISEFKALIQIA